MTPIDCRGNQINIGDTIAIPRKHNDKFPRITEGNLRISIVTVVDIKHTKEHWYENCDLVYKPVLIIKDSKGRTKEYHYCESCVKL